MAEDNDGTITWAELLEYTRGRLEAMEVEAGQLHPRWLIERAAGERFDVIASTPAVERGVAHLDAMLARRSTGEPLQYVLERWSFRTLELFIDHRVLIPRPETEMVAGVAIGELTKRPAARALDLGTGSGAIALSLVIEHRDVEVWATDVSPDALEVARANVAGLGRRGARVRVAEGSWFTALPAEMRGRFDVIVSNPPYVPDNDELPDSVERWEPSAALRSGADGLDDLRLIIAEAPAWLVENGVLVCEIDPRQAADVKELARLAGFAEAVVELDLAGRSRILVARLG